MVDLELAVRIIKQPLIMGSQKINYYTYANKAGATALKAYLSNKTEDIFLEDCVEEIAVALKRDYVKAIKDFSRNKQIEV